MATWGSGPFDDDNASDWVSELQEASDWGVVETALRGAADVGEDAQVRAALSRLRGGRREPPQKEASVCRR